MNFNLLADATLNDNLAQIVEKLKSLMDSFWIYIVIALAAVVVVWARISALRLRSHTRTKKKSMPATWSKTLL